MGTTASTRHGLSWRLKTLTRRFARSQRGVTAIEFAMVGPIFLALVGATFETALAFFAGYALDVAVIDTSRYIRTGQSSYISSADQYRSAMCGRLYGIFDCDELRISVREIEEFSGFAMSDPINEADGSWTLTERFPPSEGEAFAGDAYYMIEAYYKWPTFFNIPGLNAGQTADGKRLLAASHVLKTEPFSP